MNGGLITSNLRRMGMLVCLLVSVTSRAEMVEEVLRVPVQVPVPWSRDVKQEIVVTVWRDDRWTGPLPVAILGHGRSHEPEKRASADRRQMARAAQWLARLGFLVASPVRVGYGETGGPDLEFSGSSCERKSYPPGYAAAADQVLQVLAALRERSDAAKDKAVVIGQSYGGATAIAVAARNPPGVQAVVNFAGGGGGNPQASPQQPCSPHELTALFRGYGRTARLPTLWIYTENDQYFGHQYPRQWFEAFQAAGGVGIFAAQPAFGADGHSLFARGLSLWAPQVEAFLRSSGALPPQARTATELGAP